MELLTDRLHQVQDLKRRRQLKNHRLTIQVHIEVLSNWKFRTNIHQVQDLKKKKKLADSVQVLMVIGEMEERILQVKNLKSMETNATLRL